MPNAAIVNFMRDAPSLRWRMSFWTTVVTLSILAGLGVFLYDQAVRTTESVLTERLMGQGQLIALGLSGVETATDEQVRRVALPPMLTGVPEAFAVGVYAADGSLVAASTRPMPEFGGIDSGAAGPRVERRTVSGLRAGTGSERPTTTARVLMRSLTGGPGPSRTLVIVSDDTHFDAVLASTMRTLVVSFLVGAIGTLTATWFISGSSLRPLRKLGAIASSFSPEAIRAETKPVAVPSELAEFQRELSSARERLSESLRAQDRLISNVSHELKTPIAVLLIESETIDLGTLPEDGVRFVRSVREEMRRLGGMIESCVLLSRLRGSGAIAPVKLCALNDVLLEAVGGCHAAAQRRGVTIRADAVADAEPPMLHGDAELLATMFSHVIRNCIRFSRRGDEIEVSASTRDGGCSISIADTGSPIPEPMIAKLFDRFVEDENHCDNRRELGLQVAQGVAELHGGRISAVNRKPLGCMFTIELPLASVSRDGEGVPGAA